MGEQMDVDHKPSRKIGALPWLKLLLGVVPSLVFGVFTVVFTIQQNAFSDANRELDQQQTIAQRKQSLFDNCIDVISDLLVSPHFNRSDVRHLRPVRERILMTLRQVDPMHKRDLILFLYTNELIRNDVPSTHRLDLHGADLTNVHFEKSATMDCLLPNLYLRGVLASNIVFSSCALQYADFGESEMAGALFHDCWLTWVTFKNANLDRITFRNSVMRTIDFEGTSLIGSSFQNNSIFVNTLWINTNLFQSNILNEDLLGITPTGSSTTVIMNVILPNGSVVIDQSQLIVNGGAEKQCNATFHSIEPWAASVEVLTMETHMQVENSSVYPLPVEGYCYFILKNMSLIGQIVDVSRFSRLIDTGKLVSIISAHLGCSNENENAEAIVSAGYLTVDFFPIMATRGNGYRFSLTLKLYFRVAGLGIRTRRKPFVFQSITVSIPIGTRFIRPYIAAEILDEQTLNDHPTFCTFDDVQLYITLDNNQSRT